MIKKNRQILVILIAFVLVWLWYLNSSKPEQPKSVDNEPNVEEELVYKDLIKVTMPARDEIISSPLVIIGEARGGWFFEANFPIVLVDWDGRIIGQAIAQADGNWMTSEFVPFHAQLTFDVPPGSGPESARGTLILNKDNPSGIPALDDAFEIPIRFRQ